MDTLALALRVVLALAVVFGLLWLSWRIAAGKTRSGSVRGDITVVARQGLTQKAAAVLVDSGDKRYLLGVTEAGVTLLDTLDRPAPEPSFESAVKAAEAENRERADLWLPASVEVPVRSAAAQRRLDSALMEPFGAEPPRPDTSGFLARLLAADTWKRALGTLRTGKLA